MISYDLDNFVGTDDWVLVFYAPSEGQHNLAWIKILEQIEGGYIVLEVDSSYYEGDITSSNYRYIGGTSNQHNLLCNKKYRSKEELHVYEPCTLTSNVFNDQNS